MRALGLVAAMAAVVAWPMFALPKAAMAQPAPLNNVVAVPLAPPLVAATPAPPPSPATAPAATAPAATAAATPAITAPATIPALPDPPSIWVPGQQAELGVLDKVDGGIANVKIPVGGQINAADLQISVQACANRPPGQLPDTAVYLTIRQGQNASSPPLFQGWMVKSIPAATSVADAAESLRVVSCTP